MEDSYVEVGEASTMYVGADATSLFRAKTVKIGLRSLQRGMRLTRMATKTNLLAVVSEYTGKKYKRTELDQAMTDLDTWISAMECAMPVVRQ